MTKKIRSHKTRNLDDCRRCGRNFDACKHYARNPDDCRRYGRIAIDSILSFAKISLVLLLFVVSVCSCLLFASTISGGLPKIVGTSLFLNQQENSYGFVSNELLFIKTSASFGNLTQGSVIVFKEGRSFGLGVFDSSYEKNGTTFAVIEENSRSLSVKILPLSNVHGKVTGRNIFFGLLFSIFGKFRYAIIPCASFCIVLELLKIAKHSKTNLSQDCMLD